MQSADNTTATPTSVCVPAKPTHLHPISHQTRLIVHWRLSVHSAPIRVCRSIRMMNENARSEYGEGVGPSTVVSIKFHVAAHVCSLENRTSSDKGHSSTQGTPRHVLLHSSRIPSLVLVSFGCVCRRSGCITKSSISHDCKKSTSTLLANSVTFFCPIRIRLRQCLHFLAANHLTDRC